MANKLTEMRQQQEAQARKEYAAAVRRYLNAEAAAASVVPAGASVAEQARSIWENKSSAAAQQLADYDRFRAKGGTLGAEESKALFSTSFYMPEKATEYDAKASNQAYKDQLAYQVMHRNEGYWDVEGNRPSVMSDNFLTEQIAALNDKIAKSKQADADWKATSAQKMADYEKAAETAERWKQLYTERERGYTDPEGWSKIENGRRWGQELAAREYNWLMADYLLGNQEQDWQTYYDEQQARLEGLTDEEWDAEMARYDQQFQGLDWESLMNPQAPTYESQTDKLTKQLEEALAEQKNRNNMSYYRDIANKTEGTLNLDDYYAQNIEGYDPEWYNPAYFTNEAYYINQSSAANVQNIIELLTDGVGEEIIKDFTGILTDEEARQVRAYYDKGYDYLLPEEIAVYNDLLSTDPLMASVFLQNMEQQLLARKSAYTTQETALLATDPVLGTAMSAATVLTRPYEAMQTIAGAIAGAKTNDPVYDLIKDNNTVRQARAQVWSEAMPAEVFGQPIGGTIYNTIMSIGDMIMANASGKAFTGGMDKTAQVAMQTIMSSEVMANTIYDDLQKGYKNDQAVLHGLVDGLIEAWMERGFMDELFDAGKGFVPRMLSSALAEGGEEIGTEILQTIGNEFAAYLTGNESEVNQVYQAFRDSVPYGTDPGAETLKYYANQFALAGLSGFAMGGGVATATAGDAIANEIETRQMGADLKQNGDVEAVLKIAESFAEGTEAKSAAKSVREELNKKNKVSNRNLGKMITAVTREVGEQNSRELNQVLEDSIQERLVELGENSSNAKKLAPVIRNIYQGGKITRAERAGISWTDNADQVVREMSSITAPEAEGDKIPNATEAPEGQRVGQRWETQTREKVVQTTINNMRRNAELSTALTTKADTAVEESAKKTEERLKGKTPLKNKQISYIDSGGAKQNATYEKVVKKNGELQIVLRDANNQVVEVETDAIDNAETGLATIIEYAAHDSRHDMSAEEVNTLAAVYQEKGGDVQMVIRRFEDNYLAGYSGLQRPEGADTLDAIAYDQGAQEAAKDEAQRIEKTKSNRGNANSRVTWLGEVEADAEVHGTGDEAALEEEYDNLTEGQQMVVEFSRHLAEQTGLNVVLFRSKARDNGEYATQNGSYDSATHTIYLDVNAGSLTAKDAAKAREEGTLGYAIMRTMGHEVTHAIEATSPTFYAQYREAVKRELQKAGKDWTGLVRAKLDNAVKNGEKLTYGGAVAEVVADASEYMLQDSAFVNNLDTSLKGKVKAVIQDFAAKVKAAFRNLTGGSEEARALRNGMGQYNERLQKLWDAAFVEMATEKVAEIEDGVADALYETGEIYSYIKQNSLRVRDKATIEYLENQPHITTYRAMQVIDGKLYPPMAEFVGTKKDGSREDPGILGRWEMAAEHPELIKWVNGKPKFELKKTNDDGSVSTVPAAYNPYMHSSNTVLNDQFSKAFQRTNLVVVECVVPAGESDGAYRAQYAKDATGWHEWKAGVVAGDLAKQKSGFRQDVFLSRYIKPVRILPDAEVAEKIAGYLDGTDVTVPFQSVWPTLRDALVHAGVDITEPRGLDPAQMKIAMEAFEEWKNHIADEGEMVEEGRSVQASKRNRPRLTADEYKRVSSAWSDYAYRGYNFAKRSKGGILVDLDSAIVYTDNNGTPEHVLDVGVDDRWSNNDVYNLVVEMEREGKPHEVQQRILKSVFGTEGAHFRTGSKRKRSGGEDRTGARRNARTVGDRDPGEVSEEVTSSIGSIQKSTREQTDTVQFRKWFKGSKIVNADGTPKVMYHGTPHGGFTVFKGWQYFTDNKEYADQYQNPSASSIRGRYNPATEPQTYEVFLSVKRPFDTRIPSIRKIWENEFHGSYSGTPLTAKGLPDWTDGIDLVDFIEENGYDYDAIILDEGGVGGYGDEVKDRGTSVVVRESTQIKSATDNVGTFDPENPDIRYSRRTAEPDSASIREMLGAMQPTARMTETEKLLLKRYQEKLAALEEKEKQIEEQEEIIRTAPVPSDDLTKAKNRYQIYRTQANRIARELAKTERNDGFARLMATSQEVVNRYLLGSAGSVADASNELDEEIADLTAQLKAAEADVTRTASGQRTAFARGLFDQTQLTEAARKLKDAYGSRMSVKSIENRLALAYGELYATKGTEGAQLFMAAAKDLAYDLLKQNKFRYKSELLPLLEEQIGAISLTETDVQEIYGAGLTLSEYKRMLRPYISVVEGGSDLSSVSSNAVYYGAGALAAALGDETEGNLAMRLYNLIADEKAKEMQISFEGMPEDQLIGEAMADIAGVSLPLSQDSKTIDYLRNELLKYAGESAEAAQKIEQAIMNAEKATRRANRVWMEAVKEIETAKAAVNYYRKLEEQRRLTELVEQKHQIAEQLKTKYAEKLKEQVDRQRAEYREREQRAREYRHAREDVMKIRRRIGRNVKRLNALRMRATDQKHVPEDLNHVADLVMQTFTDSSLARLAFSSEKAASLAQRYRLLKELESDATYYWDDEIETEIDNLRALSEAYTEIRERGAGVPSHLSAEGVKLETEILSGVDDIVSNVLQMIDSVNDAFLKGRNEPFDTFATRAGEAIRRKDDYKLRKGDAGKLQTAADELLKTGNMTPVYFMEHLDSPELMEVYDEIRKGQSDYARIVAEGKTFVEEAKARHHYGAWVADGKLVMKTSQGHEIELTREEAAEIYAIAKRERATRLYQTEHLLYGGFRYKDASKKGSGKTQVSNTPHQLDAADIDKIERWLTTEQKKYADELVEFLSTTMADYGNEASMAMYGYKKFKEKYYIPFHVAAEQRFQRGDEGPQGEDAGTGRIRNSGFTHKVQHKANATLVVGGLTNTVSEHIHKMATYASLVEPVENLKRLLNHKVMDPDGTTNTIRALIGQKYGQAAQNYLTNLLKDLNGAANGDERATDMVKRIVNMFKRGAVMASASVMLQQPTAMARAMAFISPKYFTQNPFYRPGKGTWDEMMKYAGTAVIKDMGKFDVGMGQTATQYIADEHLNPMEAYSRLKADSKWEAGKAAYKRAVDWLTAAPGVADQWTWGLIWKAVKAEQAELHPKMAQSSEKFLQMCGERFDNVIDHTQVYDSVLTRSDLMRSKNAFHQMATSFMAEPTLSLNMLWDALTGKHSGTQRAKIIGSVIASQVLAGAMAALAQAWNDDDDKRSVAERYTDRAVANILDNLNPLSMIPYVSDVMSLFEGYDVERPDMSVIKDVMDYTTTFFSKATDPEKKLSWKDYENFVGTLANAVGLPAKNISREIRRTRNLIVNSQWEAPTATSLKQTVLENIPGYSAKNTAYYERIVAAELNGDTQKAEDYREYMLLSKMVSEETLAKGLKAAMQEAYIAGRADEDTAIQYLLKIGGADDENDAWWQVDKWSEMRDEGIAAGDYRKYDDFLQAVETGENLKATIQEYLDHGVSKTTLASQITSSFKQRLIDAKQAGTGYADLQARILTAYEALGYDRQQKLKDIQKWFETK